MLTGYNYTKWYDCGELKHISIQLFQMVKQWSKKALHRQLKIEQEKPRKKTGVNSGALEGLAAPFPPVRPAALLLNDTNIIDMEIMLDTSIGK